LRIEDRSAAGSPLRPACPRAERATEGRNGAKQTQLGWAGQARGLGDEGCCRQTNPIPTAMPIGRSAFPGEQVVRNKAKLGRSWRIWGTVSRALYKQTQFGGTPTAACRLGPRGPVVQTNPIPPGRDGAHRTNKPNLPLPDGQARPWLDPIAPNKPNCPKRGTEGCPATPGRRGHRSAGREGNRAKQSQPWASWGIWGTNPPPYAGHTPRRSGGVAALTCRGARVQCSFWA
jgi:hypothetical protein